MTPQSYWTTDKSSLPELHRGQPGGSLAIVFDFQLVILRELDLASAIKETVTFPLVVDIQNEHSKLISLGTRCSARFVKRNGTVGKHHNPATFFCEALTHYGDVPTDAARGSDFAFRLHLLHRS